MAGFPPPGGRGPRPPQRKRLLIVCEDQRAGRDYLEFLRRAEGQTAAQIVGNGGDPVGAVEEAARRRDQAIRDARRIRESDQRFDQVWAVVDVDSHQRLDEARTRAVDVGVELVVCNPCFELWLWLHFADASARLSADDMRRGLDAHLTGYRERKRFDEAAFQRCLYPRIDDAIRRADQLSRLRADGTPGPCTDLPRLVRVLRSGK
jgi:hypothetical protein